MALAAFGVAASAGVAAACAICLSAVKVTPGQRLDNADQAVLATASEDGTGWRILETIKGEGEFEAGQIAADVAPEAAPTDPAAVLLVRDGLGQRWSSLGAFPPDQAEWLRSFAATPVPASDPDAESSLSAWHDRLDIVAPVLAAEDPAIEAMAHGELARAPYAALRDLGAGWSGRDILALMGPEEGDDHIAAFIHMLGASGDDTARDWIAARLEASDPVSPTILAALIAADLEMNGPSRVDRVEQEFLLARDQDLPRIEAALLALRIHGETDASVPRARVVAAYEGLVRRRPALAGLVVMDLARWEEWGATDAYEALLNTGTITDPADEFAARNYVYLSANGNAHDARPLRDD